MSVTSSWIARFPRSLWYQSLTPFPWMIFARSTSANSRAIFWWVSLPTPVISLTASGVYADSSSRRFSQTVRVSTSPPSAVPTVR